MEFSKVKKLLKSHNVMAFGNKAKIKLLSEILDENETILTATECTYDNNKFTIFVVTVDRIILVHENNQTIITFDKITKVENDDKSISIFYDTRKTAIITNIEKSRVSYIYQIIENRIKQIKQSKKK